MLHSDWAEHSEHARTPALSARQRKEASAQSVATVSTVHGMASPLAEHTLSAPVTSSYVQFLSQWQLVPTYLSSGVHGSAAAFVKVTRTKALTRDFIIK